MAFIRSRRHAASHRPCLLTMASLAFGTAPAWAADPPADAPKDQEMPAVRATGGEAPFKADTMSSPKFTQPLVDTPQTITVIKKELLKQQNATTLTEALRNTPGVTMLLGENGNTQTGDAIVMRGFDTSASIFVDNIRDLGGISRDVFNIEQIEVVKGPSGADNGRGASSGYVNLVTKAPTLNNFVTAAVTAGSASRVRATADVNQKLDSGPGIAWRLNVMKDEGGVPGRDTVHNDSWAIAPSLSIGLGTPTIATFYYLHSEAHNRPDGGVPTMGLPSFYDAAFAPGGVLAGTPLAPVNSSNYYGSRDDFNNVVVDMFTARIEHTFTPALALTNTTRIARSEQTYVLGGLTGTTAVDGSTCNRGWFVACDPDPDNWTVLRSRQILDRQNQILTNQTNLAGAFDTGGVRNNLSGGVELIYERQNTPAYTSAGTIPPASLYNPSLDDAFPPINLVPSGAYAKGSTLTAALYGFHTLTLDPQWKLNYGLRWERYKTDFNSVALSTAAANPTLPVGTPVPTSLDASDDLFSWKAGALYKPAENGSIYVAFGNSKQPPGGSTFALSPTAGNVNNPVFKPQEGSNAEIGTKWDLLNNNLALAVALYRSENKNEPVQDPLNPGVFSLIGKRRVQGIEVSAIGRLSPVWDVNAGFTTMDTEIVNGFAGATNPTQGGVLQWTPEVAFTLWSTYKLPGGFTLGGGARYIDAVVRSSVTNFTTAQSGITGSDAYWVFDAVAVYDVNKNVSLQLNLYNLFDEQYIAAINNSGKRYYPGAPRSALLTANFRF